MLPKNRRCNVGSCSKGHGLGLLPAMSQTMSGMETGRSCAIAPEWEMKEAEGLGGFACRLADLAHHRDLVGPYLHLKELWTEITCMSCL